MRTRRDIEDSVKLIDYGHRRWIQQCTVSLAKYKLVPEYMNTVMAGVESVLHHCRIKRYQTRLVVTFNGCEKQAIPVPRLWIYGIRGNGIILVASICSWSPEFCDEKVMVFLMMGVDDLEGDGMVW